MANERCTRTFFHMDTLINFKYRRKKTHANQFEGIETKQTKQPTTTTSTKPHKVFNERQY